MLMSVKVGYENYPLQSIIKQSIINWSINWLINVQTPMLFFYSFKNHSSSSRLKEMFPGKQKSSFSKYWWTIEIKMRHFLIIKQMNSKQGSRMSSDWFLNWIEILRNIFLTLSEHKMFGRRTHVKSGVILYRRYLFHWQQIIVILFG